MQLHSRSCPRATAIIFAALLALTIAPAAGAARIAGTSTSTQGGPLHTGSVPSASPAVPLHAAWSVDIEHGVSTPVIADDLVISLEDIDGGSTSKLVAYDRVTGAIRWSRLVARNFLSSDIAYDEGRVYVMSGAALLQAMDAHTGAVLWTQQLLEQPFGGRGPVAVDGTVYVGGSGGGGDVWAIDGKSGQLLWDTRIFEGASWAPMAVDDDHVYVTAGCAETWALDRDSGDVAWHYFRDCGGGGGATPVVDGDHVEVQDWQNSYRLEAATGELVTQHAATKPPVFSNGIGIYTTNSGMTAYDADGTQAWSYTPPANVNILFAPVATSEVVYVVLSNAELVALNLDSGASLGEGPTGFNPFLSSSVQEGVAIAEGTLTVSRAGHMVVFGEPGPDTEITSSPATFSSSTSASIPFSSPTSGATFTCSFDGSGWTACSSPFTASGLGEGHHSLSVRAGAGGATDNSPTTREWTVDTTAPDTILVYGPSGTASIEDSQWFFVSSEGAPLVRCRIDAGAWFECGGGAYPDVLTDGSHTIEAAAYDAAGNADPTPITKTWSVDATAPHTTIANAPAASSSTNPQSVSFSGSEPGNFYCALDDEDFAPCTSPWTRSNVPVGDHALFVAEIDAAGNPEDEAVEIDWTQVAPPPDSDTDGRTDVADNCPHAANPDQRDTDHDGQGDACDLDDDGDKVIDYLDHCPATPGNGPDGCLLVTDPSADLPGLKGAAADVARALKGGTKRLRRGKTVVFVIPALPAAGVVDIVVRVAGRKAIGGRVAVAAGKATPLKIAPRSSKLRKLFAKHLVRGDITIKVTLADGRSASTKRAFTIHQ